MPGAAYTLLIGFVPAPPDLIEAVQEIQVELSTTLASVFRIRFAIGQTAIGDWTVLQEDLFRPLTPISIRAQVGLGLGEPLINGYVTAQRVEFGNEPGRSTLEVVGMDATVRMNLEEKVTAWPNMPDSTIATLIFGQYGLVPQVEPTQPVRVELESTTIQRGTDIRFLRRLAERNGFECYVTTDPLLGLDVGVFGPPQLQGPPHGVLSVNFGADTNVDNFRARYEMLRPAAAYAAGLDIATKSPQLALVPVTTELRLGREGLLDRVIPPPSVLPSQTGQFTVGELQPLTQGVVDRSAWAIVAEGELNMAVYDGILRPGRTVNVRGAGQLYSGTYYVTRVLHSMAPGSYTQRFELRRNAIGLTGTEVFVDLGI